MPAIDASYHDPRISMNYWWPRLAALDVPTPETVLVPVQYNEEGSHPVEWDTEKLVAAVEGFDGDRAFLRTDRKSARFLDEGAYIHSANPDGIDHTVMRLLIQLSDMDILPASFAMREHLSLDAYAECYGQTVAPEVRFFVDGGKVLCWHLRTTESDFGRSIEDPNKLLNEMKSAIARDEDELRAYAEMVAEEFDETGWSVDFVRTESGDWYCIDMALYGLYFFDMRDDEDGFWKSISHHESGCPHNLEENLPDNLPAEPENARTCRLMDR